MPINIFKHFDQNFFRSKRLVYKDKKDTRPSVVPEDSTFQRTFHQDPEEALFGGNQNSKDSAKGSVDSKSGKVEATKGAKEPVDKDKLKGDVAVTKAEKETKEALGELEVGVRIINPKKGGRRRRPRRGRRRPRVKSRLLSRRPVTRKSKDRIKKRMGREIYGNDQELREKYRVALKEAIEKMPIDSLHEFIIDHTPARNSYESDEYAIWNRHFVDLINTYITDENLRINPGDTNELKKSTWIVGGLQQYLVDYFKTDVFEADKTRADTNPFIYVDGRLGAYTISAMSTYWTKEHGTKDPTKEKLGYGELEPTYAAQKKNGELFTEALTHLNVQVGNPPEENISAPKKKWELKRDAIRAELVDKGVSEEALFAFDQSWSDEYRSTMRPIIMQMRKESRFAQSPEAWLEIHNGMLASNAGYKTAFEDRTVVPPTPEPTPEPTPAPGQTEVAEQSTPPKTKEKALPESQFLSRLRSRMNSEGFDFNRWFGDDYDLQEEFAKKIYEVCKKHKIPTSAKLIGSVAKLLIKYAEDPANKDIDYGRPLFRTDTQIAAQKAEDRRLINNIERDLRKEYLGEKLVNKDDEPMDEDGFVVEMITELDEKDVDFQSWGFEYNAREAFAKNAFKLCERLKLPASMRMMREMVSVMRRNFMPTGNNIEYYTDPDDAVEIATNDTLMEGIGEGLLEKYKPQEPQEGETAIASR